MREARTFLERLLLAAALPRGEMAGSVGMACLSVERSCRQSTICSFGIELSRLLQVLLRNGAPSLSSESMPIGADATQN
jgi:hypothetical protein